MPLVKNAKVIAILLSKIHVMSISQAIIFLLKEFGLTEIFYVVLFPSVAEIVRATWHASNVIFGMILSCQGALEAVGWAETIVSY